MAIPGNIKPENTRSENGDQFVQQSTWERVEYSVVDNIKFLGKGLKPVWVEMVQPAIIDALKDFAKGVKNVLSDLAEEAKGLVQKPLDSTAQKAEPLKMQEKMITEEMTTKQNETLEKGKVNKSRNFKVTPDSTPVSPARSSKRHDSPRGRG